MISVIIPIYQAERFIEKAVQSAFEQAEVSEIILVEDNSNDNSRKICEHLVTKYRPKVLLFEHPDGRNHGAGASRNLGLKKATCEYVAFLDADDYYLPDRFTHDIRILSNNKEIDGVYNALGVHIYDKEEQGRIDFTITTVKYPIPPDKLFEEMAPIGGAGYFAGDTLTVRRDIFNKVGHFDTTLELSQDTHMWVKMAAIASLVAGIIDKPVAIRGVHSDNRVKDTKRLNHFRPLLFLSLVQWAQNNNITLSRRRLLWNRLAECYYDSISNRQIGQLTKAKLFFGFLVQQGINNPHLLGHRNYHHCFMKLFSL